MYAIKRNLNFRVFISSLDIINICLGQEDKYVSQSYPCKNTLTSVISCLLKYSLH